MLQAALAGLHFLALVAVVWMGWCGAVPDFWMFLLVVLIVGSAVFYWLRRKQLVARPLQVSTQGVLALDDGHGWEEAEVLPCSLVMPCLTLLRVQLKESGKSLFWLVLPDAVNADSYRELRVWLKWGSR